ncbi:MAG: LamG domain-containing protein [Paludibacter sp.]
MIFCIGIIPNISAATDPNLKVQYGFNNKINIDSIIDETGNGYTAKLMGGAKIKKLGAFSLLEIGTIAGYVDMGAKLGEVVSTLSDFSISTYLYVDPSASLTSAGNFVWTFSNAANIATSATGCMFYTAKDSRYAISTTNYSAEKGVNIAAASAKGAWKHITYVQSGTKGYIYIDGVSTKSGNVTLLPTTLGATAFNYIGKSAYASDQMLLNSMICDFRIYNKALTATEVLALTSNKAKLDTLIFTEQVETVTSTLSLGNLNAVTTNLTLPTTATNGATITWSSSKTNFISNVGVVTRPVFGTDTARVVLTATVTRNFVSKNILFNAKVVPSYTDLQCTQSDAANIAITGNLTNLRSNLQLPILGLEGSSISWSSNKTAVLSNAGVIVSRPAKGSRNAKVTMTATVTKGSSVSSKLVDVYVA